MVRSRAIQVNTLARIFIVFGTTEGHTRKIAEFVAKCVGDRGLDVTLVDSARVPEDLDLDPADGFVLAGSLHQTLHQRSLVGFVKEHLAQMQSKPSLFLSISLTAVIDDDEHQAAARKCIGKFIEETGWIPTEVHPVAGALKYTEYDFVKRMLMRMIAKAEGGATDTSQDYEYTNWGDLQACVEHFLEEHLKAAPAAS